MNHKGLLSCFLFDAYMYNTLRIFSSIYVKNILVTIPTFSQRVSYTGVFSLIQFVQQQDYKMNSLCGLALENCIVCREGGITEGRRRGKRTMIPFSNAVKRNLLINNGKHKIII